mgnify:CR=1 FL=1
MPLKTLAAAAGLLAVALPAAAADYRLDPAHTRVLFAVDQFGIFKMTGTFTETSGRLSFDPAHIEASKLDVTVRTASVETHFAPGDTELKSPAWLDVAEFPEMKFVGTKFTKKDDRTGTITGDLTLRGVTKPVSLEVTLSKLGARQKEQADATEFSARGSLKRSEFGLKAYLPYIADEVDLVIETEATR